MVVITMTNCPQKLRGDLSKWLCEINTGVYVGQISARVRDALWIKICENISNGQATMVYSVLNEQHLEFCTHNSTWKVKDKEYIIFHRLSTSSRYSSLRSITKPFWQPFFNIIISKKFRSLHQLYSIKIFYFPCTIMGTKF